MGRVSSALSGNEAHGGSNADGPYKEVFSYDAWGNTTSLTKRVWTGSTTTDGAQFSNNRRQYWNYDASGFITYNNDGSLGYDHQYDAAGKRTELVPQVGSINGQPAVQIDNAYDGNGLASKQVDTRRYIDPNTAQPSTVATTGYYLHSTVLGGQVIAELDAQGNRTASYVYLNGMQLAKEQVSTSSPSGALVTWQYSDPVTGSMGTADFQRNYLGMTELDPLGTDVTSPPPIDLDGLSFDEPVFSDPFKRTYFEIDGQPTADHKVDDWYLSNVNKGFDAWNADRFERHGFRDVAMDILAHNPNVGIVVSGGGEKLTKLIETLMPDKNNGNGSFTYWGRNAATALGMISAIEDSFADPQDVKSFDPKKPECLPLDVKKNLLKISEQSDAADFHDRPQEFGFTVEKTDSSIKPTNIVAGVVGADEVTLRRNGPATLVMAHSHGARNLAGASPKDVRNTMEGIGKGVPIYISSRVGIVLFDPATMNTKNTVLDPSGLGVSYGTKVGELRGKDSIFKKECK